MPVGEEMHASEQVAQEFEKDASEQVAKESEKDASEEVAKKSEKDASEEVAQAFALSNEEIIYTSLELHSRPDDTLKLIHIFLGMNPDFADVSEDPIYVKVIKMVRSTMDTISSENPENALMTKINAIIATVSQDVSRLSEHKLTDGIPVTKLEIFLRLVMFEFNAFATEDHIAWGRVWASPALPARASAATRWNSTSAIVCCLLWPSEIGRAHV